MHTRMYAHMHTHIHMCTCSRIHMLHACKHTCIHKQHMHAHMYTDPRIDAHTHICMCMHARSHAPYTGTSMPTHPLARLDTSMCTHTHTCAIHRHAHAHPPTCMLRHAHTDIDIVGK